MFSLVTSFCSCLSLGSDSCIDYVNENHPGFWHLYSEALGAFPMNVDLPGLWRLSTCPLSGGAYEHSWEGHMCGGWARARRPLHVYEFSFAMAGAVF